MRMPFKKHVQQSRMERLRCGVQSRAADAAHSAQSMADRARPMASDAMSAAQSAAQSAAMSVSGASTSAAHAVAGAANTAAQAVAERTKPLAGEAALRGSAAWTVLRYGVPAPGPIKRAVALVPIAKAAKTGTKSKTGSALMLMTLGGVTAAGVTWWRKSRSGTDSVWILDETDDLEPPDGWHEGAPVSSARAADRRSAADRVADRAAGLTDSEPRKRSDTWP
jgi:hypothetical protein